MAKVITYLYCYIMLLEDTAEKSVAYLGLSNRTEDPKTYSLGADYAYEILRRDDFQAHPIDLDAWLGARAGHTFNYYLVYAPFGAVLKDAEPNDILEWTLESRVFDDGQALVFSEDVRLRDVVSESGVWTYDRGQAIEDNKYTVLDTGTNPYTTL